MRALIRESLLKNKALELPRQIHGGEVRIMAGFPAGPGRFAGPADIAAAAFSGWLREQSTDVILGVAVQGTPGQPRRQWQRAISGQSYLNGLKQAAIAGARLGLPNVPDPAALFELPRHQEAWRVISQRQYQLLQGVSFDMADDLRTVLGEGLRGGLSVDEITKNLVDRVSKLEATRARSIAVTETTFANAEATLNALQDMGIQQVTAMVEFVTTSGRPCPLCTALEGQIFTIEEARRLQLIPQHPSCVCQFLPVPVEERRMAA
jgi:SPP1 gp7 family putative phage head morphogenesis protein